MHTEKGSTWDPVTSGLAGGWAIVDGRSWTRLTSIAVPSPARAELPAVFAVGFVIFACVFLVLAMRRFEPIGLHPILAYAGVPWVASIIGGHVFTRHQQGAGVAIGLPPLFVLAGFSALTLVEFASFMDGWALVASPPTPIGAAPPAPVSPWSLEADARRSASPFGVLERAVFFTLPMLVIGVVGAAMGRWVAKRRTRRALTPPA